MLHIPLATYRIMQPHLSDDGHEQGKHENNAGTLVHVGSLIPRILLPRPAVSLSVHLVG